MKLSDFEPTEGWTPKFRGQLVLAAWILAALAAAFPEPVLLLAFPLFPLGLLSGIPEVNSLFPQSPSGAPTASASYPSAFVYVALGGWAIYFVLSVLATATKRRTLFFILYMVLVTLLILNVRGCQSFMKHLE
jgi:hypothetical protein